MSIAAPPPGWTAGGAWPPAPYGWPPAPAPRNPNRGLLIALIALIGALVVVVAVGAVLLVRQSATVTPGTPTATTPTTPTTPTPTTPVVSPTPVISPTPPATSPEPTPDPGPSVPPHLRAKLAENPLLTLRMPKVACKQSVRPLPTSKQAYEKYIANLVTCAENSYRGSLTQAGFTLTRPPVIIYQGDISTPCGNADPTYSVFYCPPNQTIYTTTQAFSGYLGGFRLGSYYIVFHEFAHHVQQRADIIDAGLMTGEPTMQIHRRIELQADCFSAIHISTLTTVTDEDWAQLVEWRTRAADEPHGQTASQLYWLRRGFDTDAFGDCNTWATNQHVS